ncbi:hypothetical protein L484_014914 [Morus notabilis]|uniref:DDT domain-containing protein n=1 Tax=Morus notabilis TaxID=981085 RepID=W9QZ39_9ROSA|nr:hypothetical protein L484_014914 [Morus notabilis]
MAVGRRTCDEPSASDSDGGEAKSQPPEKKADVVVVSDDGERGEEDRLKAEVKELRGRWELASVLNFLTVFQPVIGKDLRISAEEIETGLVNPDNSLAQLHITLLKGIPPASKTLDGSDAWVTVLRRKLSHWWSWVAEGEIPLMAAKGEETSEYKGLDPKRRLLILKALCEIRADQDDTVAYIKDSLKQGTQISSFRKENIGGNGNGTSFWYEGNTIIGHRLYRGVTTFGTKTKSRGKKCLDPPSFQWETLATDLEEFRKLADEFSSSEVVAEVAVGKTIKTDAIPALEKIQKNRESAMKRKQMQERVLNDCRSSSTRVTRSCRNRRPVNYTYDCNDFERIHDSFGFGARNEERKSILEFALGHDFIITNTFFKKRDSHFITFKNGRNLRQIDYFLTRFSDSSNQSDGISLDGVEIEASKKFRYLRSIVQYEGDIEEDIQHRIKAGWVKWKNAMRVLCDSKMPIKLKGKFYRTVICPAMLYGSECWAIKRQHISKMSVAEMRMLRWMSGHTRMDRIRNEVIRSKVGVAPIEDKVGEGHLRWYEHVQRRPLEAPVCAWEDILIPNTRRGRDNYDRAIWEAIERTSDPERKTDSDDDLPKRDCAGDASSGKKDDAMDIDLVQEVDTDDDDYDCSSKGDVDDSDFSDSGKPELDVKNKNAGCDAPKHFGSRWSLRLAGFTNESFVENRYLGTKNRSRQRPVHNSALDAVVIRDSEDDS